MPFKQPYTHPYNEQAVRASAPAVSGVYGIYSRHGSEQDWIYVGESQDIQARLIEHLQGKGPEDACIRSYSPTSFTYEAVEEKRRVGRQDELILELHPVCNEKLG
jgi:predicted GIY-YIG superfamily endonuclease